MKTGLYFTHSSDEFLYFLEEKSWTIFLCMEKICRNFYWSIKILQLKKELLSKTELFIQINQEFRKNFWNMISVSCVTVMSQYLDIDLKLCHEIQQNQNCF